MQANKELINAFRQVAQKLEDEPRIWNWGSFTCCNCGLVAQQLGVSETTILYATNSHADWENFSGKWSGENQDLWNAVCPTSNLYVQEIVSILSRYGLSPNDMIEIENCLEERDDETVEELINYFRETADRLEVDLLNQSAEVQKENQPVSVSVPS